MPEGIDWFDPWEEQERQRRQTAQPNPQQPRLGNDDRVTAPGQQMPGQVIPADDPRANPAEPESSGYGDIDELRAAPWTTAFEQAALSRGDELVNERYNTTRQQRTTDLARRNIDPKSPLFQREMGRIDQDQAKELADFRRKLQLESIDRRQRNLGQARTLETQIDEQERQRMMDLLSVLTGNPNFVGAAGNQAANLASIAAQQGMVQQGMANSGFGSAGNMFAELLNRNQQQPINITLPSSPTSSIPARRNPDWWEEYPSESWMYDGS